MMQSKMQKPWYLKQHNFFELLSESEREKIRQMSVLKRFKKDEIIYQMEDQCQDIGIIKKGIAKVFLLTQEGSEVILCFRRPGNIIGMTSIFGWPRHVSFVSALDDVDLYVIRTQDIKHFFKSHPEFSDIIINILCARLHHSRMIIEDLATRDVQRRLIHLLVQLLIDIGVETDQGIEIQMPLTHEQLSHLVASSRQTVNLMIKEMERKKLIKKYRNKIVVFDMDKLSSMK